MRFFLTMAALAMALTACSTNSASSAAPGRGPQPTSGFDPAQLAKSDIDRVTDLHRRELYASLRLVAEKLYKRNPREWRKTGAANPSVAVGRLFDPRHAWRFPEFEGRWGTDLVLAGLREDFAGDRVGAFVGGLGGMLHAAFEEKTEFFVTDDIDPQKLYNSARNIETAVWKLAQARDAEGRLLLVSNEMGGDYNLSFEREFGKMIGNLDLLAGLVADRNHRSIAKALQSVASFVFLPVTGLK